MPRELTLNQELAKQGYTSENFGGPSQYAKRIYRDGVLVFTGMAHQTWEWLKEPLTRVVFRKYKDGDILALFPDLKETQVGHCLSYQHVGQHGAADYAGCIRSTKPASAEEYADLHKELMGRGYRLDVRKRR